MVTVRKSSFEIFYNKYSPMVYEMALQIAPNQNTAQQILISTFTTANHQNIALQTFPLPSITLIKILVDTAHQQLNKGLGSPNFKIKQFENTPILQHLFCELSTLENYCNNLKITKEQAAINLRAEISTLNNLASPSTYDNQSLSSIKG